MEDQDQEHRIVTRRRRPNLRSAVAYYGLVGLVGAALAAWFVTSTIDALLAGYCYPGALFLCHYILDLIAPTIALVVGVTLLSTAWRIRRDPPQFGPLVSVGAIVGVAVAALPIPLILAVADSSDGLNIYGSKIPSAYFLLLFAGPLLWALHSAIVVWREAKRGASRKIVGREPTILPADMEGSPRTPRRGPLLAALVVTLLASLFAAWLVRPMAGGAAHVPWYFGMALLTGLGVASLGLTFFTRGTRSGAPAAFVLLASVGATALAAAHQLFVVSTAFSGLTILIAVLGAVCVVLAIRWHRSSPSPSGSSGRG